MPDRDISLVIMWMILLPFTCETANRQINQLKLINQSISASLK